MKTLTLPHGLVINEFKPMSPANAAGGQAQNLFILHRIVSGNISGKGLVVNAPARITLQTQPPESPAPDEAR